MSGLNQRQRHSVDSESLSLKPFVLTWLNVDYQIPPGSVRCPAGGSQSSTVGYFQSTEMEMTGYMGVQATGSRDVV